MAGFIGDADLQRIRDATDIVALIKEYVPLKRSGNSFRALCPFHHETSPSFFVVPAKQIFKCFGCGAAGDVFSFVMKHDGLEFAEAVRALGRRAGVQIAESKVEKQRRSAKDKLYDVNAWAARVFGEQLAESEAAAHARKYVGERRLSPEMVERFNLGYSLPQWDGLVTKARAAKLDMQLLAEAGLIVAKREGGYHDFFRNRLMFPILDVKGRVQGFGARSLDGAEPKYLNSRESPVFNKSGALYGLNHAARAMQKEGRAVVVEGYTDVIMAHQHGFESVVAVLGTAVTQEHVRLLRRFADKAVLVLDQDSAGQASAERSVDAFVSDEMQVTVAGLSSDADPCDFLLADGKEAFAAALDRGADPLSFKISRAREAAGGRLEAAGALDPVLATIGLMGDPVAREQALRLVSQQSGVSEIALHSRLGQLSQPSRRSPEEPGFRGRRDAERELLWTILRDRNCPAIAREELDPAWIGDRVVGGLISRALEMHGRSGKVDAADLLALTQDEGERAILEEALAGERTEEDCSAWCSDLMGRLKALHAERSAGDVETQLRAAGSHEEKTKLLDQVITLRRQGQRGIGFGKGLFSRHGRPANGRS